MLVTIQINELELDNIFYIKIHHFT